MARAPSKRTDSGGKAKPGAKKKTAKEGQRAKKQSPPMNPATSGVKKPELSFVRLVREIAQEINPDMKFNVQAIMALHEASEVVLALAPTLRAPSTRNV